MILKHMLNQQTRSISPFQALADPSRRAIVERLTRGPASVSELAKPLAMSFPAVMQHLAVLEGAHLVALAEDRPGQDLPPRRGDARPRRSLAQRRSAPNGSAASTGSSRYLNELQTKEAMMTSTT